MSLKKIHIKCDNCNWDTYEASDIAPFWHNRLCPKCRNSIILDDKDIQALTNIITLKNLNDSLAPLFQGEEKVTLKFDTAPMRVGKNMTIKREAKK